MLSGNILRWRSHSSSIPLLCVWKRALHIKRSELYKKCYAALGVDETSDQNTIRRAYIELVKKIHPDSGLPEASAEKFQEIDNAFRILQEKFAKNRRGIYEDEDENVIFDIRHTAPQHRQYLSFDGIGVGSPSQRQRQYQQVKVMKAQERVLSHRLEKAQAGENSLMKKGSGSYYKNHAIKTKYGFDRIVEDLIQESMSKGDFNNLSGQGKPLNSVQKRNPYLDFTTQKLNEILLDNGFTPEWIRLQKEIREDIYALKKYLGYHRSELGDLPLNSNEECKWELIVNNYAEDVNRINVKIDKYNLIVPILANQKFRVKLGTIAEEVLNDPNIPRNVTVTKESNNNETNGEKTDFFSLIGSLFK